MIYSTVVTGVFFLLFASHVNGFFGGFSGFKQPEKYLEGKFVSSPPATDRIGLGQPRPNCPQSSSNSREKNQQLKTTIATSRLCLVLKLLGVFLFLIISFIICLFASIPFSFSKEKLRAAKKRGHKLIYLFRRLASNVFAR